MGNPPSKYIIFGMEKNHGCCYLSFLEGVMSDPALEILHQLSTSLVNIFLPFSKSHFTLDSLDPSPKVELPISQTVSKRLSRDNTSISLVDVPPKKQTATAQFPRPPRRAFLVQGMGKQLRLRTRSDTLGPNGLRLLRPKLVGGLNPSEKY